VMVPLWYGGGVRNVSYRRLRAFDGQRRVSVYRAVRFALVVLIRESRIRPKPYFHHCVSAFLPHFASASGIASFTSPRGSSKRKPPGNKAVSLPNVPHYFFILSFTRLNCQTLLIHLVHIPGSLHIAQYILLQL